MFCQSARATAALSRISGCTASSCAVMGRLTVQRSMAGESSGGFVKTEQGLFELYMRAVEPKPTKVEPPPAAELERAERVAKRYTMMMMKRQKVLSRDLQRKLKLKWAAIHALPTPELKQEALTINPFVPMHTRLAGWTPPLKGFHGEDEAEIRAKEEAAIAAAASATKKGRHQVTATGQKIPIGSSLLKGRRRMRSEDEVTMMDVDR